MNSAYNLARWLTRNEHDAEDVVQEAYLRAFRAFDTFQTGRDAQPWLLRIVRNTCYSWLHKNRPTVDDNLEETVVASSDPEAELLAKADADQVRAGLEQLPIEFREVLILREFKNCSYKEIAQIVDVPIGTVMSRLSRGRRELRKLLCDLEGNKK